MTLLRGRLEHEQLTALRGQASVQLLANAGSKLGARLVVVLTGAIVAALVGRSLGPDALGIYATGFTVASIGVFLFDPGVSGRLLPMLCSSPERENELFGEALSLVAYLMPVSTLLFSGLMAALLGVGGGNVLLGAAVGAWAGAGAILAVFGSLFTARQRLNLELGATLLERVSGLLLIAVLFSFGASIQLVFTALAVGRFAAIAFCWHNVRASQIAITVKRPEGIRRAFREGFPFWSHSLLTSLYILQGVLLLTAFGSFYDVGMFRVASTFHLQAPIVAIAVSSAVFPRAVARRRASGAEGLFQTVLVTSTVVGVIGFAGTVLTILVAPTAIRILYGSGYESAATSMRWLALAIPFLLVNNAVGMGLTILGRQSVRAAVSAVGAVSGLAIGLVLIPRFGYLGAALQLLSVEVLVTVLLATVYVSVTRSSSSGSAAARVGISQ